MDREFLRAHRFPVLASALLLLVTTDGWCAGGAAGDVADDGRSADLDSSGWILGGGLAVSDPGYVGQSRQVTPLPLIFYHDGRWFFAGTNAGYVLVGRDGVRLSLVVKPQLNRLHADSDPQLAGIQSREWSLDGGANLDLFESWGRLRFGVFHDILDRNNGSELNAGYQYAVHLGDWRLTPGLGVRWESANLTNYYYGVSLAEAIPGRPAYSPGCAINPYVGLGLSTPISEHWQFHAEVQYTRFGGAIRNSPIVDRSGSPSLFIGFAYNTDAEAP